MPTCSECGGTRFDYDDGANTTCINCGKILSSGRIVEEITFTGDGGSGVDGRLVGNEKVEVSSGAARIRELSELLALGSAVTEGALRIYSLAKDKHFTNGRKIDHVAVSCLYAICRRKETPHMLIDFSDAVNIKVQILGHTFLELCHYLNIAPPLIDPSLYLHRFASQLEFGSKTTDVTETALQFIQSMKRDWIQTGRRPSGISGAALLMAARFHGFMRTTYDIVHIVRVGDGTLRKRISEFLSTQAGSMTMSEFQSVDISVIGESETLPPCMIADERAKEKALVKAEKKERKKQKRREKRERRKKEKQLKAEASGEEEEEEETHVGRTKRERVKREAASSSSSRSMSEEEEESSESNYESMDGILAHLTGDKRKRKHVDGHVAEEDAMGEEDGDSEDDDGASARKKKSVLKKEKSKKKSKKEREREKEKKAMRKHKHAQKKLTQERLKRQQRSEPGQARHAFESTTSLNSIKHILDEQHGDEDILPVDQVNDEVMQVLHVYEAGDFERIVSNRTATNHNAFKLSQSTQPFLDDDLRFMDGVDLLAGGEALGSTNNNSNLTLKTSQPLAENNSNANNNNRVVANKAPSQLGPAVAEGEDGKEGVEQSVARDRDNRRGVDLTFDDIPDEEVDCYVRSTRDNDAMRKIWHVVNRDFLTQRAQKEREAAMAEAQEKAKPTKRARRTKAGAKGEAGRPTGEERRSSRLNYDALKILEGLEAHTRANDFDDLGEPGMEEVEEGLPAIGEKRSQAGQKSQRGVLSARDRQTEMRRLRNEDLVDYENADEDDYYEEDEDAETISFI